MAEENKGGTGVVGAGSDLDGDWVARQFFSDADLQGSPEEYAARNAHNIMCFSFHEYRFRDPALAAWIRRLHEILVTQGEVELCRQQFLSKEEADNFRKLSKEAP